MTPQQVVDYYKELEVKNFSKYIVHYRSFRVLPEKVQADPNFYNPLPREELLQLCKELRDVRTNRAGIFDKYGVRSDDVKKEQFIEQCMKCVTKLREMYGASRTSSLIDRLNKYVKWIKEH